MFGVCDEDAVWEFACGAMYSIGGKQMHEFNVLIFAYDCWLQCRQSEPEMAGM